MTTSRNVAALHALGPLAAVLRVAVLPVGRVVVLDVAVATESVLDHCSDIAADSVVALPAASACDVALAGRQ